MSELVEYRRINRTFSQLPNATAEELAGGVTCIVCRDEMDSAKKLPCGHMFHSDCLKSWLAEQQVSCRLCSRCPRRYPSHASLCRFAPYAGQVSRRVLPTNHKLPRLQEMMRQVPQVLPRTVSPTPAMLARLSLTTHMVKRKQQSLSHRQLWVAQQRLREALVAPPPPR